MNQKKLVLSVLLAAILAVSSPGEAAEIGNDDSPVCVTIWTDPPDVMVDPACIVEIIEDIVPPISQE